LRFSRTCRRLLRPDTTPGAGAALRPRAVRRAWFSHVHVALGEAASPGGLGEVRQGPPSGTPSPCRGRHGKRRRWVGGAPPSRPPPLHRLRNRVRHGSGGVPCEFQPPRSLVGRANSQAVPRCRASIHTNALCCCGACFVEPESFTHGRAACGAARGDYVQSRTCSIPQTANRSMSSA
jgi:hypothetical protein